MPSGRFAVPELKAAFFDLDGTLLDTAPDIYQAAVETLKALAIAPPDFATARLYIGSGMDRFVKRMLSGQWWGEPDSALYQKARRLMTDNYSRRCRDGGCVYAGVADALSACRARGMKIACITNKPLIPTLLLLDACQMRGHFELIIGGDSLAHKKPHPLPLEIAARALRVEAKDSAMVGDSSADRDAARAAGARFYWASYGYGQGALEADGELAQMADLVRHLR